MGGREGGRVQVVVPDSEVQGGGAVVVDRIHVYRTGGRAGGRAGSSKGQDALHDVGVVVVGGDLEAGPSIELAAEGGVGTVLEQEGSDGPVAEFTGHVQGGAGGLTVVVVQGGVGLNKKHGQRSVSFVGSPHEGGLPHAVTTGREGGVLQQEGMGHRDVPILAGFDHLICHGCAGFSGEVWGLGVRGGVVVGLRVDGGDTQVSGVPDDGWRSHGLWWWMAVEIGVQVKEDDGGGMERARLWVGDWVERGGEGGREGRGTELSEMSVSP